MTEQKNNFQNQGSIGGQENSYTQEDIQKNKAMAGLSYFLFFIPLIACPESRFARFHANQSLLLLIISIAANIIFSFIPFTGALAPLLNIALFALYIYGLANGFGGKAKPMPVIGKITIIK